MSSDVQAIRSKLESSGVDWEQPLSARQYRAWHDRQTSTNDSISTSGNEVTLKTVVETGPVAAESLTTLRADFRPIRRTVAIRGDEEIEITELHDDIIGWDAVSDSLFEPLPVHSEGTSSRSDSTRRPDAQRLERGLGSHELDFAELQARLVLNGLHADSTEQLEFVATSSGVEVRGMVESDSRKTELVSALRTVPNVLPAIFTIAELNSQSSSDALSTVRIYSATVAASPLEDFLHEQGRSAAEIETLSQQLLDSALAIKREATAIDQLRNRFGRDYDLSDDSRDILNRLLTSHESALYQATESEDAMLFEAVGKRIQHSGDIPDLPIGEAAALPLSFCEALISGRDAERQADGQTALSIADDLLHATQTVRASLTRSHDIKLRPTNPKNKEP